VYLLGLCSFVCCVVTVVCCWFVEGFDRRCVSARFV
jgi:hypothetical protein